MSPYSSTLTLTVVCLNFLIFKRLQSKKETLKKMFSTFLYTIAISRCVCENCLHNCLNRIERFRVYKVAKVCAQFTHTCDVSGWAVWYQFLLFYFIFLLKIHFFTLTFFLHSTSTSGLLRILKTKIILIRGVLLTKFSLFRQFYLTLLVNEYYRVCSIL